MQIIWKEVSLLYLFPPYLFISAPNSREMESLRVDYALSKELEEALRNDARIESVKAIVKKYSASGSASVALVIKQSSSQNIDIASLKDFVRNSFPEVSLENIKIEISLANKLSSITRISGVKQSDSGFLAVPLVPFLFFNIPADEHFDLALSILAFLALALLFGFLLGFYFAHYQRLSRQQTKTGSLNDIHIPVNRSLPGV